LSSGAISVAAAAKINLYLHVVGKRPDDYHLLDSLVAFASVYDTLHVRSAEDLSLSIDGPFGSALGSGPDNLVLRAARRLAEHAGRAPRVAITLTKRLPVASGIGGGSADAAATLRALVRLWNLSLGVDRLMAIAFTLGADVPMCLARRAAFAGGIGELLEPCPTLPSAGVLLVNPGIAVATPEVFRARQGNFSVPARFSEVPRDAEALARVLTSRQNDLTAPASTICPAIVEVLDALRGLPGCRLARMSGSGATCFGLFDDEAAAAKAARSVVQPGWWVAPGRLLHDASSDAAE
jgi:4-diphosphocytidyl-2-C-methyl-D-erythritol kinase